MSIIFCPLLSLVAPSNYSFHGNNREFEVGGIFSVGDSLRTLKVVIRKVKLITKGFVIFKGGKTYF